MRTELKKALIVFVVVATFGSLTFADVAATVDPTLIDTANNYPRADYNQSIGWRFFVDQEITITHLGLYDHGDNGLASTHTMGIWRVNKTGGLTLMRQVDIGPGGTTEDHHVYVDIEDITLIPDPEPWIDPSTGIAYYERWIVGVWSGAVNNDGLTIRPRSAATNEYGLIDAEVAGVIMIENYTWKSSTVFAAPWGNNSDYDYFGVNFKYTTPEPEPTPVDIDIKPGSYPNSINLGSNGVVPVAILSSLEFDALTVDPETVTLAGAGVAVRGKGNKLLASEEDVDGDGLLDLSLKVETENLDPGTFQDGYAILEGATYDGDPIEGYDEITIVPPE